MITVDPIFLENLIIKTSFLDKAFSLLVGTFYEPQYFQNSQNREIFTLLKNHLNKYSDIPSHEIILNSSKNSNELKEKFNEIYNLEIDISKEFGFIFEQSNEYLKDQAVKQAILKSVDIIDKNENTQKIRDLINDALCKDLKVDLGLDYFGTIKERLKRIIESNNKRIPTFYPIWDDIFNGGFPPYTLNLVIAVPHGSKCFGKSTKIKIKDENSIKEIYPSTFFDSDTSVKNFDDHEFSNINNNKIKKLLENKYGKNIGNERFNLWSEKNRMV